MIKSISTGLCILALSGTLAFAQSSQGQSGANPGPTSPTAENTKSAPADSTMKMKKKKSSKKGSAKSGSMSKDNMSGDMKKDSMGSGDAKK